MDGLDRTETVVAGLQQAASPEQHLMGAVLRQAVNDFRLGQSLKGDGQRRLGGSWIADVEAWFADHDARWPYSFENICVSLGIDPGAIREALGATVC